MCVVFHQCLCEAERKNTLHFFILIVSIGYQNVVSTYIFAPTVEIKVSLFCEFLITLKKEVYQSVSKTAPNLAKKSRILHKCSFVFTIPVTHLVGFNLFKKIYFL
jgi:hypothetical protein